MAFNFDVSKGYNPPVQQEYKVTQADISENKSSTDKDKEKDNGALGSVIEAIGSIAGGE